MGRTDFSGICAPLDRLIETTKLKQKFWPCENMMRQEHSGPGSFGVPALNGRRPKGRSGLEWFAGSPINTGFNRLAPFSIKKASHF
jgi:hypothetical protein